MAGIDPTALIRDIIAATGGPSGLPGGNPDWGKLLPGVAGGSYDFGTNRWLSDEELRQKRANSMMGAGLPGVSAKLATPAGSPSSGAGVPGGPTPGSDGATTFPMPDYGSVRSALPSANPADARRGLPGGLSETPKPEQPDVSSILLDRILKGGDPNEILKQGMDELHQSYDLKRKAMAGDQQQKVFNPLPRPGLMMLVAAIDGLTQKGRGDLFGNFMQGFGIAKKNQYDFAQQQLDHAAQMGLLDAQEHEDKSKLLIDHYKTTLGENRADLRQYAADQAANRRFDLTEQGINNRDRITRMEQDRRDAELQIDNFNGWMSKVMASNDGRVPASAMGQAMSGYKTLAERYPWAAPSLTPPFEGATAQSTSREIADAFKREQYRGMQTATDRVIQLLPYEVQQKAANIDKTLTETDQFIKNSQNLRQTRSQNANASTLRAQTGAKAEARRGAELPKASVIQNRISDLWSKKLAQDQLVTQMERENYPTSDDDATKAAYQDARMKREKLANQLQALIKMNPARPSAEKAQKLQVQAEQAIAVARQRGAGPEVIQRIQEELKMRLVGIK